MKSIYIKLNETEVAGLKRILDAYEMICQGKLEEPDAFSAASARLWRNDLYCVRWIQKKVAEVLE